ncbi:MAG: CoA-binding protein [Deltaproteobacteria bacterium]|nr:MAG: CoA-binding protein [Deltaproteobacteria bacterium]
MQLFFDPETVALIGASATPFRPGNQLSQNLEICFGERFYPVNPRTKKIGDRDSYPSILEVPASIDVAIIFIQASQVPKAVEQCADKGIKRVIIESGGFAEVGPEGKALHDRCLAVAREADMRLWGPNCMGCINVTKQKVLSFLIPMMWQGRFMPGRVSLVVQSGMLSAGFLASILYKRPFGLSKVASIGNKMDVDEVDLLEYLVSEHDTGVIAMYLESMGRGRRFLELARSTSKPIVVLKAGRTDFGREAANSHTAAMAQDDRVLDSALRQAGVIRVRGMTELLDVARSLGMVEHRGQGRARVAILSFSGGAGVVASDMLHDHGLELAKLRPETLARIKQVFPEWMEPANPVDVYPAIEKHGPDEPIRKSLEAVMEDPEVDAVFIHIFAAPVDVPLFNYGHMSRILEEYKKQMVVWIMGAGEGAEKMTRELEKRGIPVVDEIGKGVRIIAALAGRR